MAEHKPKRNAEETRQRILEAARLAFSRNSYEQLGVRELAAEAGVNAALVNRYFGSKEGLFREAVSGMFHQSEINSTPLENFGQEAARHIVARIRECADSETGFDPLQVLLRSAVSPVASPILAEILQEESVNALAARLSGSQAVLRAGLINAYAIGLATMLAAFHSPALNVDADAEVEKRLIKIFGAALQACIDE